MPARRAGVWIAVAAAVLCTHHLTVGGPAGRRMVALCLVLLYSMKAIVAFEYRGPALTAGQWLAFTFAWPGMRPAPFRELGGAARPEAGRAIVGGVLRLLAGITVVVAAERLRQAGVSLALATPLLLAGLSLSLHFGLFDLATGFWRLFGVDVGPVFQAPWAATSLQEFWGRRWNRAFSEMTAATVYGPITAGFGRTTGLLAAFLVSGLFHELAISAPVHEGYGGPLAYFALHGTLMALETRWPGLTAGRPRTLFLVLAPTPILFHGPFLEGVIWPIARLAP